MLDARETPARLALLVVDVQAGLVKKKLYKKAVFLSTIRGAITAFRNSSHHVVFIRHDGAVVKRGTPGWELFSGFDRLRGDPIIDKERGNAFEKTDLVRLLDERGVKEVLVCGLVSHGCVRATCLGGAALGFKVALLKGGHSNWAKDAAARISATELELETAGIQTISLDRT